MKWVGLTGGIATGKSSVSKVIREMGYPIIDADELARIVVQPGSKGLQEVVGTFGEDCLQSDGRLDRKKLAKIIFNDPSKREALESILHPMIQELKTQEKNRLENEGFELGFYEVPLLFEKNLENNFDAVVLVFAPEELQIKRLKNRDGMTDDEIKSRLKAQIPIGEKQKKAKYVIENIGDLSGLKSKVKALVQRLASDLTES